MARAATSLLGSLWRLRGPRRALVVLSWLAATAIFAPLVANDRPYVLEGIDRGGFERARRELPLVAAGIVDALGDRPRSASAPGRAERLAAELRALELRLDVLRATLDASAHAEVDALAGRVPAVVDAERAGELEAARAAAGAVQAEALRLAEGLRDGAPLVARTWYPVAASLAPLEVFWMLAWLWVLLRPLAVRIGAPVRRPAVELGLVALLAAGGALAWDAVAPEEPASFDPKTGLTDGSIEETRVVFPPLAMGFAETHMEEAFRPPTWTAAAEIDEAGRYVRGPRAARPTANPVEVRSGEPGRNAPWRHALGTDSVGRDLLARLFWGGRVSLSFGALVAVLLVGLGVLVGAIAGYFGGWVDWLLSRVIESVHPVPTFFLVLVFAALVPASVLHPLVGVGLVVVAVEWTGVARLVRGEMLRLRELDHVLAARALGFSSWRVLLLHALPLALPAVLVATAFAVGYGMLLESAVSFLGFGVRPPVPSWGALIGESKSVEHWWMQLFPGLAIFLTVLCTHVVGDGLRDAADPRTP